MEKSSHYYALLALCRICGINKEESEKIAYASQFVDDAKINNMLFQEYESDNDIITEIDGQPALINIATCHSYFKINTFNYQAMINNTSAFHFIPGCEGNTFTKKMRCKEDSEVIIELLEQSLNGPSERFGMMLHIYADTFSHQGFSGLLSKENDIRRLKGLSKIRKSPGEVLTGFIKKISSGKFDKYFDKLVPAYGHGQALHYPDIPYMKWSYEFDPTDDFKGLNYVKTENDNIKRFNRAFRRIAEYIEKFLQNLPDFQDTRADSEELKKAFFNILKTPAGQKRKIKMWQGFMSEHNLCNKGDAGFEYDENAWLAAAFKDYDEKKFRKRAVFDVRPKNGFEDTSWFKFIESVKWYKNSLFPLLAEKKLFLPE